MLDPQQVVRAMHEAFSRGDAQAALDAFHPDVEWDGRNIPDGAVRRGRQAVLDHATHWASIWSDWTIEVERLEQVGSDTVIAYTRERGRSEAGVEMDERHAEVYVVRDGLIVRRAAFSDPADALPAVRAPAWSASARNADVAAEVVEAVARMDESRLVELTDPEVEWHSFIAQLGGGGVYRGHEGMREYARDLHDAWDVFSAEIHDTIAVGEVVVMVGQLRYRGKGSGVDTESAAGWIARFRRGRIVYLRSFRDPEAALAAVGLAAD